MRVGFFTVFRKDPQHYIMAEVLIRSIRATMPGTQIVQLTDTTSPEVYGVDAVERLPVGKMLERRIEHYARCGPDDYGDGDWLLLDTDTLVRRDVRDVFDDDNFEIALADRYWPHLPETPELTQEMPFNTGVVFSRNQNFWKAVLAIWRTLPEDKQDWLSEQRVVAQVVKSNVFGVKILPGAVYNYPPAHPLDGTAEQNVSILHYKGGRKEWMRKLWTAQPEVPACA